MSSLRQCDLNTCLLEHVSRRSNKEGNEENEVEDEARRVEEEVMNAALAADSLNFTISSDLVGKVEETCGVGRSSSGGLAEEPFQHVGQSLDCSQVENDPEEKDAADWLMDDEMRQWEEFSKDQEENRVRSASDVLVVQAHGVKREAGKSVCRNAGGGCKQTLRK